MICEALTNDYLRPVLEASGIDPEPYVVWYDSSPLTVRPNQGQDAKDLYDRGMKIVDLSADFRLKNPKDYVRWYGWEHPFPEMLSKSVYGVPELHREEIKKAQLVSCPGCMAVTSLLALKPLIENNLIDTDHLVVDSKIGSSGAGQKANAGTHHAMRYGVVRPYKPAKHRHTGEIEQELSLIAKKQIEIAEKEGAPYVGDTPEDVLSGRYPLSRYLYLYVNKAPGKPLDPLTIKDMLPSRGAAFPQIFRAIIDMNLGWDNVPVQYRAPAPPASPTASATPCQATAAAAASCRARTRARTRRTA